MVKATLKIHKREHCIPEGCTKRARVTLAAVVDTLSRQMEVTARPLAGRYPQKNWITMDTFWLPSSSNTSRTDRDWAAIVYSHESERATLHYGGARTSLH